MTNIATAIMSLYYYIITVTIFRIINNHNIGTMHTPCNVPT